MRFELSRLTDYSPEAILDEIRRVAELVEKPTISRSEFRRHSRVSSTTVSRHFGGWEKALALAGLSRRFDSSSKPISEEEVLTEIRRVAQLLGVQRISREQFNAHARFKDGTVRNRFGSWHKAMSAAGLLTNSLGKRYTDDDCFENLLSVWTYYGRAPAHDEMKIPPSVVGPKAYIRRFGTWTKALQAFIDRVNVGASPAREIEKVDLAQTLPDKPTLPKADSGEIRLSVRYTVLKRDCFRCVVCGQSPATQLGLVLHIDHVIPVAKGGRTVLENLRSLCEECNLGKGARHEG